MHCFEEYIVFKNFCLSILFFATFIAGASISDAQQIAKDTRAVILAQAGAGTVILEIKSLCVNGVATFKIYNLGERWPRMGTLKVFRVEPDGLKPISERKMCFAQGQTASFRMKKAGEDKMALYVEPSWYERSFQQDAEIQCVK